MGRFRQSMNWLHTWSGLVCAWLLYFIFITGSLGYFENEIDRWMKPELVIADQAMADDKVLTLSLSELEKRASDASMWYISYPSNRDPFIEISWLQPANQQTGVTRKWHEANIDPKTGKINPVRDTIGAETLYRLHYNLHYIPVKLAYFVTSLATMIMMIALITGIIIHKKIFIEFFTFRVNKGLRSWLDIHNVLSVLPLPFHLMITYSGLLLLMTVTLSPVIDTTYGQGSAKHREFYDLVQTETTEKQLISMRANALSLESVLNDAKQRYHNQDILFLGVIERNSHSPIYEVWLNENKGVEFATRIAYKGVGGYVQLAISTGKEGVAATVYDVFEHLHEGLFAGPFLRWVYFISGLMGAAMIATGAIIWTRKRLQQRSGNTLTLKIIARLNAGFFVGVLTGLAVFFLSNRLLPFTFEQRANWEIHSLFITLFLCLLISVVMRANRIWTSLLLFTAFLFALIPIVNSLTTEHNLIQSILDNDKIMLGFDLFMMVISALLLSAGLLIKNKGKSC